MMHKLKGEEEDDEQAVLPSSTRIYYVSAASSYLRKLPPCRSTYVAKLSTASPLWEDDLQKIFGARIDSHSHAMDVAI